MHEHCSLNRRKIHVRNKYVSRFSSEPFIRSCNFCYISFWIGCAWSASRCNKTNNISNAVHHDNVHIEIWNHLSCSPIIHIYLKLQRFFPIQFDLPMTSFPNRLPRTNVFIHFHGSVVNKHTNTDIATSNYKRF